MRRQCDTVAGTCCLRSLPIENELAARCIIAKRCVACCILLNIVTSAGCTTDSLRKCLNDTCARQLRGAREDLKLQWNGRTTFRIVQDVHVHGLVESKKLELDRDGEAARSSIASSIRCRTVDGGCAGSERGT